MRRFGCSCQETRSSTILLPFSISARQVGISTFHQQDGLDTADKTSAAQHCPLRQRGTPSAGFCLHFNHSRHDTAECCCTGFALSPTIRPHKFKAWLANSISGDFKPIWPAIAFTGLPYPEDFSLAGRVPHTQTWGNYQWVGLSRCV